MNEECYQPGGRDQAKCERRQDPEQHLLHTASTAGSTVVFESAALRFEIQLAKRESEKQNGQHHEGGAIRFQSGQVRNPSPSNT